MNKYQQELLQDAIDKLTELEGSRFVVAPKDYPPSEWRAYKRDTAEIQHLRMQAEQLLNVLTY